MALIALSKFCMKGDAPDPLLGKLLQGQDNFQQVIIDPRQSALLKTAGRPIQHGLAVLLHDLLSTI